jgi:hypothetical protein
MVKGYRKELITINYYGTFQPVEPLAGEKCTPIMDINVVKKGTVALWTN